MRKNLALLQEQMKARMQSAERDQTEVVLAGSDISSSVLNNNRSTSILEKVRLQDASIPDIHNGNVSITNSSETPLITESSTTIQPTLCSHCKRRVCRRGSTLCSRCTGKGIQQELRDTLPGLEIKRELIPSRVSKYAESEIEEFVADEFIDGTPPRVTDPTELALEELYEKDKFAHTYSRKEVASILGVSATSILRWEQKGKVPLPLRIAHNGQLIYTEEHVAKLKEFMSQVVIVQHQPRPDTPENQKQDAAKFVAQKTFKMNKGLERVVSVRLGRIGGKGLL